MPDTALTDDELDAIEARANAATAGPWKFWDNRGMQCRKPARMEWGPGGWRVAEFRNAGKPLGESHQGVIIGRGNRTLTKAEDSAFIACARTDVPKLVAEVRRLRELVQVIGKDETP